MTLRESIHASLGPAFTIDRDLERPGTSAAFVAHDGGAGRDVAIEVLAADVGAAIDLTRFKREINFAARLEDPNIVPLLSAGAADGLPYVVSAFVDGQTLRARIAAGEEVPSDEVLRILRDVASALAHGHERGVLHRDLRAENVILTDHGAMVADFGVARAIFAAGGPGDPKADNRSDIRAFGILGYELLTGHTPVGDTPEPIQKYRVSPPTGLAPLIMRCLHKNPAERPETASKIVGELDEIISPSDSILASLWPVESPTLVARSDYYKRRGIMALVAVTVVMLIAGFFAWRTSGPASSGAAAAPPTKAVAVLPLENVGGDSATLYFAQGVSEELRSALARVPGAAVASDGATTAAVAADSGRLESVGGRLHVTALAVGQLRRSRDSVHLDVQLRNAGDTAVIWKSSYARPAAGVFQLEDDVVRAIATALRLDVPAGPLAVRGTASAQAHDYYLQGKFLENRHSDLEISQALGMFQQALRQDPKYVAAWAGVANCWARLADDFVAPKEAVPHLRDAVAHGLALDSTNASLRFMHGRIAYLYDRDPRAAQGYMSSAVAADPNLPEAIEWLPQVLWTNGASDSARAFVRHAVDRDSISPATLFAAWQYAKSAGNTLDALEFCSRLEALHAAALCDALQQLDVGRDDQAVNILQSAANAAGPRAVEAQLGYATVLLAANRTDDARKLVAAVDRETTLPGRYMREDDIALMHGMIGDSTGALRWYEKALAAGSAGIGSLYWRTIGNPLRKDPQLLDFAKRAGLQSPPPYWP